MKVLLDENIDHRLRQSFSEHEVFTASYMGSEGLKNVKRLNAAESNGFEVLLTGDQSLIFEQNLSLRKLAVVALSSVEWRMLRNFLPKILAAMQNTTPGSFQSIDCGKFSRKKTAGE